MHGLEFLDEEFRRIRNFHTPWCVVVGADAAVRTAAFARRIRNGAAGLAKVDGRLVRAVKQLVGQHEGGPVGEGRVLITRATFRQSRALAWRAGRRAGHPPFPFHQNAGRHRANALPAAAGLKWSSVRCPPGNATCRLPCVLGVGSSRGR